MKKILSIILILVSLQVFSQLDMVYTKKGMNFGKEGKYKKALKNFDKALQNNPTNVTAIYYKGYIYEQLENYNYAINLYTRAINLNAEDFMYYRRGKCYFFDKQDSLAILDFNEALKRMPTNTEVLMSRASAYLRSEQYEKLLIDLNTRLAQDSTDYFSKANKSIALNKLNRFQEALDVLFELEKEIPSDQLHRVYNGIADTYMSLDKLELALSYIEKSISINPVYNISRFTKAEILLKKGDIKNACDEYKRSKNLGLKLERIDIEIINNFETLCND